MPRTAITIQKPSDGGMVLARANGDATNNHEFINNGSTVLIVKNGGVSSIDVTLNFAADKYGRTGSKVVAVAASAEKVIGPFVKELYNQSDNKVQFDLSAAASVTVAALSPQ
ncbi:hypothetical protein A3844_01660 [Paenibacillus helianthi]|uniref:Uncharacterized protein n=1 Tax=Paenibacillus helianthi TaxID=1349432 RepID=A0ABX3EUF9_9BACL|nr:hypothetical protein [Paenibacillus helianthi]OKP91846.1 hypothetical protein A3844_01660 [Paenibacillus helianthi]